jgi:hypothetical protein
MDRTFASHRHCTRNGGWLYDNIRIPLMRFDKHLFGGSWSELDYVHYEIFMLYFSLVEDIASADQVGVVIQ